MKNKILIILLFFIVVFISSFFYIYIIYPQSYSPEKAIDHGDVIVGASGGNSETFHKFKDNISNNKSDKIRVVIYGVDGEPSIIDLSYDGTFIHYKENATRKYFGEHRYTVAGKYDQIINETQNEIIYYYLIDSKGKYPKAMIYKEMPN